MTDFEIGITPLFERARKENLCFHCNYQDLWFTPDELQDLQSDGQFRWGAVNWTLLKLPANKTTYRGHNIYSLYGKDRRKKDRRSK
jgi:hypothetical protein